MRPLILANKDEIATHVQKLKRVADYIYFLYTSQARNQDFMWGVLTRPKWTKLPKCIFYCLIRLFRKVAIHEKL